MLLTSVIRWTSGLPHEQTLEGSARPKVRRFSTPIFRVEGAPQITKKDLEIGTFGGVMDVRLPDVGLTVVLAVNFEASSTAE